jgi:uncharacterized protein YciI
MKRSHILLLLMFLFLQSSFGNNNYYFVFLNTNPEKEELSKEQIEDLQNKHLANIDSLYQIGKLVAAGPFEGGGGLFILVAPSLDSAKNILQSDPAISANRFNIELFEFNFHIGQTCSIEEPFEMTSYHFIRYYKGIVDLDQNSYDNLYIKHLNLYKNYKDSILLDGRFEKNDGFIQIINMSDTEKIKDLIKQDSLVNQNYYYSEIKKLWIAKGTFCNK